MSGLHVHRAERADALVEALGAVLRSAPADPFAIDVIAVPARGVERWLTQRLSHSLGAERSGDGVCANVVFPPPTRLVADAVAAASGIDAADDPWAPERLLWTLLAVVDDCAGEPWCAVLARHLRGGDRRMVTAQHLTALFTSYAEQRPSLLLDWLRGGRTDDTDGAGGPLPADLCWQAELWRRLRLRLDVASPAERLDAACAALRADPDLVDLPGRLSIFGPTRLTRAQVRVLAALAEQRDVHLWLPHPSASLWDRVHASADTRRRTDPTAHAARHQLLTSLGRDAREMQLLLAGAATTDTHHRLDDTASTLLGQVQSDLRADRPPPGAPRGAAPDERLLLDPADRSLQVHACHGRARQVEVLREVLLGLLADDRSLEPRDVLVMCPDIETYAPLVSATFGLADADTEASHPGHRLRVRLADRSLRQTNPLLSTLSRLLELADSRVTASQVLDLLALPPVRRRFALSDDDLERVRDWVSAAGVRWGLDPEHRAPFAMQGIGQNTWQAGLDRLLLGAAMSEDEHRWVGLALPLDDVDSTDIDLAGRLAELVDRLGATLDDLLREKPLAGWLDTLSTALDSLTRVDRPEEWQLAQARRQLAEVAATADDGALDDGTLGDPVLSLADVRALLADRLAGRPTRANFRTGHLTMCSMVPMRSVPHRVICLLGLDDGVFPRTAGVDGDDVLARDPLVGERDRRSEDRQLLLDALLAAREHLVVLYTGADERTNTPRPPAVPLGEILDVVDATARTAEGAAREQVVVRHPLQPFDARNFTPGALGGVGPFSFDGAGLAGATAARRPRRPPAPFLPGPLPPLDPADPVELDALVRWLEHPVRGFLRQRLRVGAPDEGDEVADALTVALDPLGRWAVGNRWLRARQGGADSDTCRQVEWRRGELPPGPLGARLLDEVAADAERLVTAAAADQQQPGRAVDVSVHLTDGRELRGTVAPVHGHTLSRVEFGSLRAKHRLRAWAQLLALAATYPDEPWLAATVGRSKPKLMRSTLSPPPADAAAGVLSTLVQTYERGRCEPLPLPQSAAAEYADRRLGGSTTADAQEAAGKAWLGAHEHTDDDHARVWGAGHDFTAVRVALATADDHGANVDGSEHTRFAALACRLWLPLLAAENLAPL